MSELSQSILNYLVKVRGIFNQYAHELVYYDSNGIQQIPSPAMHPALRPEVTVHDAICKLAKPIYEKHGIIVAIEKLHEHLNRDSLYVNQHGGKPFLEDSNEFVAILTIHHHWYREMYEKGYRRLTSDAAAKLAANRTLVRLDKFFYSELNWEGKRQERYMKKVVLLKNPKQVEIDGIIRTIYEVDPVNALYTQYKGVTVLTSSIEDTNFEYMWLYRVSKSKPRL